MFCSVQSMGLNGIESYPVTVEVDYRRGLPRFDIVGLPDTAVKESRERVHSAIGNLGYAFPTGVLVVNLAPADTKKSGPLYDLPILLGILSAGCGLDLPLAGSAFVGEISLDGRLRPVNGVLSMVSEAARQGYFVKNPEGTDYLFDFGEFDCGVVDLSMPRAFAWYKDVIKQNIIALGFNGGLRRISAGGRRLFWRRRHGTAQPLA